MYFTCMIMMVKYNINKKVKNMQSDMDMIMLCWGITGKINKKWMTRGVLIMNVLNQALEYSGVTF